MALDMAVSNLKKANGEFNKTHSALKSLIGMSDETAQTVEMCLATVNLAVSAMEIGLATQKLITMATKEREIIKATALTVANGWNPAGWAKIGVAVGASALVGAGLAVYMNSSKVNPTLEQKIQADLSTASGRTAVAQLVGVMA